MPKAKHYGADGKVGKEVELPAATFGVEPNEHVVWEAVKCYLANQRQGTVMTKTRSEVRGGGKKPWRQKGTGRARAGSSRSPVWVGGGTVFGPRPRDYGYRLPRKIRRLALRSALSARAQDGNVGIVDAGVLDAPRTKGVADFLKAAGMADHKVCLITKGSNAALVRSVRNLRGVTVLQHGALNVYELLKAEVILVSEEAVAGIEEVFGS